MDVVKKIFVFLIFILSLNFIYAEDLLNDYEYLKLEITNEINFELDIGRDAEINNFQVNSFFFPQSFKDSQYLNSFETNIDEEYVTVNKKSEIYFIEYELEDLVSESNYIKNEFILESTINMPEIKEKVEYDLTKDLTDYEEYLGFEGLIDLNSDIRNQASEIAAGEDDVYIIASKVAKWIIEDIEYDLSTVLENPNQKSTEVFVSKTGVCREITNLYISMMRSLGIPARVVSGFSYTNSQEIVDFVGSNWGGHAWAEVLIGDEWVPFDLTYNQYGFVDSSHIVTDKHSSLRTTSVSLDGSGFDFSIVKGSLTSEPSFKVLEKRDIFESKNFKFQLEGPDEVGFNSYGYLRVDIENQKDYYQILFINFAKPSELEVLDPLERMLIFRPNEKKTTYFRYKVPELDEGFVYTFPLTIYNNFVEEKYEVKVRSNFETYEKLFVPTLDNENGTKLSDNKLEFNCDYIIDAGNNKLSCDVRNTNNYEITDLKVCVKEICQDLILKLNERKEFLFDTDNFEEIITYSYGIKKGEINVVFNEPQILNPKVMTDFDEIQFLYEIENNFEGLEFVVYDSGNEIYRIDAIGEEFIFKSEEGLRDFLITLEFKDKSFDEVKFEAKIKERNFVLKFIHWFLDVIEF